MLPRILARAWLGPFTGVLFVVVTILMLGHVRKAAATVGPALQLLDVAAVMVGLLPALMTFALPLAHLIAVVFVMGRMADDGELIAWSAAGVSPLMMARGPLLLGLGLVAAGLLTTHVAEPAGWRLLQRTLTELATRNLTAGLDEGTVVGAWGSTVVAVREAQNGASTAIIVHPKLGVILSEKAKFTAKSGRIDIQLERGERHSFADKEAQTYRLARFDRADGSLDLSSVVEGRIRLLDRDAELSTAALIRQAHALPSGSPRRLRLTKTAVRRTALPTLALVFAIVGVAAGYLDRRWRWFAAMLAVLGFYLLMRLGDAFAAAWPQAVFAAVWGPIIICGGLGLSAMISAGRKPAR
ncbi:MAG: LptF/LptG family permease [Myxococcota bacterium]